MLNIKKRDKQNYIRYSHYAEFGSFRDITLIESETTWNCYPFYKSTGLNSHLAGTWLPFVRVEANGWLRKPVGHKFPKEIQTILCVTNNHSKKNYV